MRLTMRSVLYSRCTEERSSMPLIIGVDVGGTLLRAASFDENLTLLERVEQPSHAEEGTDAVLNRLYETIQQVLPDSPDDLTGIGVAVPGPLDSQSGLLLNPPNLPLENMYVGKLIAERVGGPVYVGNDADLAGLAEAELGAGRGSRCLVYMTVSTGVGGGIILDGRLHVGAGQAGEIGHMVVQPGGSPCGCGKRGHLESYAAGAGIARIARTRLEAGEESSIRQRVNGKLDQITARIVGEAAQAGDPLGLEIITQAGHYLGVGIATLMMVLNPDRFVIGGGVARLGDLLFEPMHRAIREYTIHPRYYEGVPIVRAALAEDVGLYGAAALVRSMQR